MINRLEPDFKNTPGIRPLPHNYPREMLGDLPVDVSIITPYYNTDIVFIETVRSVLAQSLQNWEWIIVDDGSSDSESVERLRIIADEDDRIKVFQQSNAGPGAARNTAFANAAGRYICLLDSDDIIEPTYLEKCAWFLDSNLEYAFCNSCSVVFGDQEYLWSTGFERGSKHLQANSGPPISVIRHSAYTDCGGFDESIRFGHEDWDFWLAMAKAGHWGYTIQEYLQWYRKRGSGRFEQIMQSGNVNDNFEKMISIKYAGLNKVFPTPSRPFALPYETINTVASVNNPLIANEDGRRIMFVVPWMVTGGADRVNLDLLEGLVGRGHDITVCSTLSADNNWEHQFSHFTPDIFILPNFLKASDYPRFLAYLIVSRKIDTVVITGSTIGYQLLPYLRAVSPGVAFVDMCHVEEAWFNGGHPRFGIGYQDTLDLNIVTTRPLAEWMHARGADSSRIRVMHTGVRAEQSSLSGTRVHVRAELNIAVDIPIIIFAGRLCEQKRPALLIEILNGMHAQGLEFAALIIGDGEQRGLLEKLLNKFDLTNKIKMLGSVSHSRWLELLVASDILLMPSQYEGISIALLEAMAAGVIPVVAKVGGQEDVVTSDVGVLIAHGDGELIEYQSAIQRLLSNPAVLQQMSAQCRSVVSSKFSWVGMIDEFLMRLNEAHQLRLDKPRYPIPPGFALEIATQALECKRLGEAVDGLWHLKSASISNGGFSSRSKWSQLIMRSAVIFSQTWLGNIMLRNDFIRRFGKKILGLVAVNN